MSKPGEKKAEDIPDYNYPTTQTDISSKGSSLILSPDESIAIIGSREGLIHKIQINDSVQTQTNPDIGSIWSLVFDSKGNFYACGSQKLIKQYNSQTLAEIKVLEGHSDEINSLSISSNDKYLYSGCDDHTVRQWPLTEKQIKSEVLYEHKGCVYATDISSNNNFLVTGCGSQTIIVYNIREKKIVATIEDVDSQVWALKISPCLEYFFSGQESSKILVWNFETFEKIFVFEGHSERVRCMSVSPDSRFLISGSIDKTIGIWDVRDRKRVIELTGSKDWVKAAILGKDYDSVYSTGDDQKLTKWNLNNHLINYITATKQENYHKTEDFKVNNKTNDEKLESYENINGTDLIEKKLSNKFQQFLSLTSSEISDSLTQLEKVSISKIEKEKQRLFEKIKNQDDSIETLLSKISHFKGLKQKRTLRLKNFVTRQRNKKFLKITLNKWLKFHQHKQKSRKTHKFIIDFYERGILRKNYTGWRNETKKLHKENLNKANTKKINHEILLAVDSANEEHDLLKTMVQELTEDLRNETIAKNNLKYKFEQALLRGMSALNIENLNIQQEIIFQARTFSETSRTLLYTPDKFGYLTKS